MNSEKIRINKNHGSQNKMKVQDPVYKEPRDLKCKWVELPDGRLA